MTNDNFITAASLLATAWNTDHPCSGIPDDCFPQSMEQAYIIQDLVSEQIKDDVVGWKVGFPPSGAISGRVYSRQLYSSPTVLSADVHPEPNIECEIAFRIEGNPPSLSRPAVREDYASFLRAFIAIELTGRRVAGAPHGPSNDWEVREIVADNSGGGGLVIGPELLERPNWDFSGADIQLDIDGVPVPVIAEARERDLLMIVVDLANQLSGRGISLKAGDYISSGSLTVPVPLPVGSRAKAEIDNCGEIDIRLE